MSYGNNFSYNTLAWVVHSSVHMSILDANDRPINGWFNVGTCKSAVLNLASENLEIKETQSGQNNVTHKINTAKTGEVTLSTISFGADNMAMALYGDLTDVAQDAAAVHTDNAYLGRAVLVPGFIEAVGSITDEAGTTTYVAGTNFVVSDGGIEVLADQSGAVDQITDGQVIKINYTKRAHKKIEGFMKSDIKVAIAFTGVNVANEDKPVKVIYHKVSLDPAQQRQLISTEQEGELEIKGTLLTANYITDPGESKLFREEMVI